MKKFEFFVVEFECATQYEVQIVFSDFACTPGIIVDRFICSGNEFLPAYYKGKIYFKSYIGSFTDFTLSIVEEHIKKRIYRGLLSNMKPRFDFVVKKRVNGQYCNTSVG